jgi:hypothetical protein
MGKNPGKEVLKTVWPMNKEQLDDAGKFYRQNAQNIEKAVIS